MLRSTSSKRAIHSYIHVKLKLYTTDLKREGGNSEPKNSRLSGPLVETGVRVKIIYLTL